MNGVDHQYNIVGLVVWNHEEIEFNDIGDRLDDSFGMFRFA